MIGVHISMKDVFAVNFPGKSSRPGISQRNFQEMLGTNVMYLFV